MKFYEELEFTFTTNQWHELFADAAAREGDYFDTDVKVSDEAAFFSEPSLDHLGKLRWVTREHTYHAAAISSVCGIKFVVVPEGGNGFNVRLFWENQKNLIWTHPEVEYRPDPDLDIDDCYH
jgi:hypothetical protein